MSALARSTSSRASTCSSTARVRSSMNRPTPGYRTPVIGREEVVEAQWWPAMRGADHVDVGGRGRGLVHDAALEHHDDPVGQREHLVEVLADQQHGGAARCARPGCGRGSRPRPRSRARSTGLAAMSTRHVARTARARAPRAARCRPTGCRSARRRRRLHPKSRDQRARLLAHRARAGASAPRARAAAWSKLRSAMFSATLIPRHAGVAQRLLGQAERAVQRGSRRASRR